MAQRGPGVRLSGVESTATETRSGAAILGVRGGTAPERRGEVAHEVRLVDSMPRSTLEKVAKNQLRAALEAEGPMG